MKIKYSLLLAPLIFLSAIFYLSGCGKSETEIMIDEPLLSSYQTMANPKPVIQAIDDIDCYIDYSFGMGDGMKATESFNSKLRNFLVGKKVSYYVVGGSDTPPLIDINSKEANFMEMNNFRQPVSKLKVAIDRMTGNIHKSSIFITDFERVENIKAIQHLPKAPKPHPIDASAWAQTEFKSWLTNGNQIDIFAKEFQKPDVWFGKGKKEPINNWVYTIVFTPDYIIKDETLYKQSVLKSLNDEYPENKTPGSRHFTYTANHFTIEQGKKDDAIGNANDNIIVQENITQTKDKGFEYYHFLLSDLLNLTTDESQKDKRIINKVMITSNNPCFSQVEYELKVYNITSALTELSTAQSQEAPEVNINEETGKKDTVANKPINYTFQKGTPVNDVFDFVYNPDTKALGIKLKPDFTGVEENTVYQVDIIVKSAALKDFNDENNVLTLHYYKEYQIDAFAKSISLAMKDVATAIENKVLYTIYIKIDK